MYSLNESSFRMISRQLKKQIAHLSKNFTVFSRQYKCKEREGHLFFNNIKIKYKARVSFIQF